MHKIIKNLHSFGGKQEIAGRREVNFSTMGAGKPPSNDSQVTCGVLVGEDKGESRTNTQS